VQEKVYNNLKTERRVHMPEVNQRIKIAVDAMGGDYAPGEIIKGVVYAAEKEYVEIALVGPMDILEEELAKHDSSQNLPIRRIQADQFIEEGEPPALAVHSKPNASITMAATLLKTGEVDALVSAGPTGATLASVVQLLGTLPGIERPAVCVPLLGLAPNTVLVDGGANIDCKPQHLLSFAVVGSVYAKNLLNISNPKIALLNIGAEEGKGGRLIRESYPLLRNSNLDFIGNIEGNEVLSGRANVIVCDGIIGNIVMKLYESLGYYIVRWLKDKLGESLLDNPVKKLLNQMSSFSKITGNKSGGGDLLWGVNGVVQVMHGNSRARQVSEAIARARDAVKTNMVEALKSELSKIGIKRGA
jgi:glycerol-3-phosphate acyltransferase PlsX